VLDAGSGLGHGLAALRSQWPQARFSGLERSLLLRAIAAWRCPWARQRAGDMWQASWAGHDVVYLFQRPESMPRAMAKARQELLAGSWLISLEFAVPGVAEVAVDEPMKPSAVTVPSPVEFVKLVGLTCVMDVILIGSGQQPFAAGV
jgi:hypothetical protein